MIPIVVKPAPDELLTAWFTYLAKINGMSVRDFCFTFLNLSYRNDQLKNRLYFHNMIEVCERHQDMKFFPDIFSVLYDHTPFLMDSVCSSRGKSAYLSESILYPCKSGMGTAKKQTWKICPECQKKDFETYGRTIVHTVHQFPGLTCCPEHGCRLIEFAESQEPYTKPEDRKCSESTGSIPPTEQELQKAKYVQTLESLETPLYISGFENVINQRNINNAIKTACISGYIKDEAFCQKRWSRRSELEVYDLPGLLAYLNSDMNALMAETVTDNHLPHETEEFELLSTNRNFGVYKCKCCGKTFVRHEYSVEIGLLCPYCHNGYTKAEEEDRLLERYHNGEYEYTDESHRQIRHKPCGKTKKPKLNFYFFDITCYCEAAKRFRLNLKDTVDDWQNVFGEEYEIISVKSEGEDRRCIHLRHKPCGYEYDVHVNSYHKIHRTPGSHVCPICYSQNSWRHKGPLHSKIGEYRMSPTGIGATVIDHKDWAHIRIRFDNGLERDTGWYTFNRISENSYSFFPEFHVGMKKTMKDGNEVTITEYTDWYHIKVRMADGSIRENTYEHFKKGSIKLNPSIPISENKIYKEIKAKTEEKGFWEFSDGLFGNKVNSTQSKYIQNLCKSGKIERIMRGHYRSCKLSDEKENEKLEKNEDKAKEI